MTYPPPPPDDGAGGRPPSPFDEHGRLIGRRRRTGLTGALPLGLTPSGSIPMNWQHSGPIPLAKAKDGTGTGTGTGTGGLTLTGGISLGLRGKRRVALAFDPVVRGRGLTKLSRHPVPTTRSELQRAVVRWVVTLWIMIVLFQRFGVPNQPVAIILPLTLIWCVYGVVRGVLQLDSHRFAGWMAITGLSAAFVPLQIAFVHRSYISLTSWGLLLTIWLMFVFRTADRRQETYLLVLRGIVKVCMWFAVLVIVMFFSQWIFPYQDWLKVFFPQSILLTDFTIAYPISWDSPIYKANGWIGLEPSVVSFQLGVGLVSAILLRSTMPVIALLAIGILCTTAGSGIIIVGVALVVMLFSAMRWALARYALLALPLLAFSFTEAAAPIVERASGDDDSASLRALQPYDVLWPRFISDPLNVLFGSGPGSSQEVVTNTHIVGLLVPTPLKIFYEYGVIAGLALAVFFLFMYLGGPSRSLAITIGASLWTLQPGTTTAVFTVAIPLFITWWTPRTQNPIESIYVPSPNAAIAPSGSGRRRSEVRA
jgi:hypothetical protein